MKAKRYKKDKTNNPIKRIVILIIMFIFILIMIFSGIKIIEWLKENKQSKDITDKIQNTISVDENINSVEKYNVDFERLKQTNPEAIAWIKVNGTKIEYPVVKTTNNDFYITHSFDKSYNSAGWAFMDYKNKLDGKDKNIVIYAHNRRDDSMFGTLKNILTEEWKNNTDNHIIPFITENEKSEYQVFSVYKIEIEDYYITTNFETNNEFQRFVNVIKSRSEKDFEIDVSANDNILTLSTCADNNKYRIVLHAKKIK